MIQQCIMVTTGREYDRMVIALILVCFVILVLYVLRCNDQANKRIKQKETSFTERVNELTKKVSNSSQMISDLMAKPKDEPEVTTPEDKTPIPVSSTFLG